MKNVNLSVKMSEFIVKFNSHKFLIAASSRSELDSKISIKINKVHNGIIDMSAVKIQQYHPKLLEFFDLEDGEIPDGGVLVASIM